MNIIEEFKAKQFKANIQKVANIIKNKKIESIYKDGNTPLIHFVQENDEVSVEKLLKAGANPNQTNEWKQAPIMWSSMNDDTFKMTQLLIKYGADFEQKNAVGDAPIHMASFSCAHQTMKYLIELGANINELGQDKKTPLHIVCEKHDEIGLRILMENKNINPKIKNAFKKTAFQTALEYQEIRKSENFIKILVSWNLHENLQSNLVNIKDNTKKKNKI